MKMSMPDLVMPDYTIPVMEGLRELSHIKRDSLLKNVPVIMVTAHSQAA